MRRHVHPVWGFAVVGITAAALLVAGLAMPSNMTMYRPGQLVSPIVTGSSTSDGTDGRWMVTTIVAEPRSRLHVVLDRWRGEVLIPEGTGATFDAATEMRVSQRNAFAAATNLATGELAGSNILVTGFSEESPALAAGVVLGDIIVKVANTPVSDTVAFATVIAAQSAPYSIHLAGRSTPVTVRTSPGPDGRNRLGVVAVAVPAVDPDELSFRLDGIGGSSGGLILALAALDALVPGDLTGGLAIAGTGDIKPDGFVGPVFGGDLKRGAALAGGAEVYFEPGSGQPYSVGPMKVIPVRKLTDAVDALCVLKSSVACELGARYAARADN